jgi:hypothetical protein
MTVTDERKTQCSETELRGAAQGFETAAMTPGGAYSAEVLRVVRGTPNAEELAALVAALLLTRRAHEHDERAGRDEAYGHCAPTAPSAPTDRPAWLRGRYSAPGSWTAGP